MMILSLSILLSYLGSVSATLDFDRSSYFIQNSWTKVFPNAPIEYQLQPKEFLQLKVPDGGIEKTKSNAGKYSPKDQHHSSTVHNPQNLSSTELLLNELRSDPKKTSIVPPSVDDHQPSFLSSFFSLFQNVEEKEVHPQDMKSSRSSVITVSTFDEYSPVLKWIPIGHQLPFSETFSCAFDVISLQIEASEPIQVFYTDFPSLQPTLNSLFSIQRARCGSLLYPFFYSSSESCSIELPRCGYTFPFGRTHVAVVSDKFVGEYQKALASVRMIETDRVNRVEETKTPSSTYAKTLGTIQDPGSKRNGSENQKVVFDFQSFKPLRVQITHDMYRDIVSIIIMSISALIFLSADTISTSRKIHIFSGGVLGVVGLFLIILFVFFKFIPQKRRTLSIAVIFGSFTTIFTKFSSYFFNNLFSFIQSHPFISLTILFIGAFIGSFLASKFKVDSEGQSILFVFLRIASAFAIIMSSKSFVFSSGVLALLLFHIVRKYGSYSAVCCHRHHEASEYHYQGDGYHPSHINYHFTGNEPSYFPEEFPAEYGSHRSYSKSSMRNLDNFDYEDDLRAHSRRSFARSNQFDLSYGGNEDERYAHYQQLRARGPLKSTNISFDRAPDNTNRYQHPPQHPMNYPYSHQQIHSESGLASFFYSIFDLCILPYSIIKACFAYIYNSCVKSNVAEYEKEIIDLTTEQLIDLTTEQLIDLTTEQPIRKSQKLKKSSNMMAIQDIEDMDVDSLLNAVDTSLLNTENASLESDETSDYEDYSRPIRSKSSRPPSYYHESTNARKSNSRSTYDDRNLWKKSSSGYHHNSDHRNSQRNNLQRSRHNRHNNYDDIEDFYVDDTQEEEEEEEEEHEDEEDMETIRYNSRYCQGQNRYYTLDGVFDEKAYEQDGKRSTEASLRQLRQIIRKKGGSLLEKLSPSTIVKLVNELEEYEKLDFDFSETQLRRSVYSPSKKSTAKTSPLRVEICSPSSSDITSPPTMLEFTFSPMWDDVLGSDSPH